MMSNVPSQDYLVFALAVPEVAIGFPDHTDVKMKAPPLKPDQLELQLPIVGRRGLGGGAWMAVVHVCGRAEGLGLFSSRFMARLG